MRLIETKNKGIYGKMGCAGDERRWGEERSVCERMGIGEDVGKGVGNTYVVCTWPQTKVHS